MGFMSLAASNGPLREYSRIYGGAKKASRGPTGYAMPTPCRTSGQDALPRDGRPELRLGKLALELNPDAAGDFFDGVGIGDEVVLAHVERQHGAMAKLRDP